MSIGLAGATPHVRVNSDDTASNQPELVPQPAGALPTVATNCSFSADPSGSEAKGNAVGNAVVVFNDVTSADLSSTAVTVGGGATQVGFSAQLQALSHGGLTNGTSYCYRVFARQNALIDDGVGGRPTVGATRWALDAKDTPSGARLLWSRDLGLRQPGRAHRGQQFGGRAARLRRAVLSAAAAPPPRRSE